MEPAAQSSSHAPAALSGGSDNITRLLQSITDGFYGFDEDWNFTFVNESAKRMLAPYVARPEDLLGRNYWEMFPAAADTVIGQQFKRAAAERVAVQFEVYYPPWDRWFSVRGFPIDGGGVSVFFRDSTEEKGAAAALRASEEKYSAILTSIDEGFCVIEIIWDDAGVPVDYRFVEANPAFSLHTGLVDVTGRTARDLIPNLETEWYQTYGRVASTGQPHRFVQGSDAMERWFDVYAFPLGAQEKSHVGILFHDISEQRRTEAALKAAKSQAEAASRAKDDFLAALSHELRTPLTPVLMAVDDLCEDTSFSPEVQETLGMIRRNVAMEARLIDDLLDLTRVASGKMALRLQDCEAHSLIGLAIDIIRDEAQTKGVQLKLELQATRTQLRGDPARIQQVFWNLLKNAVKFTPAGGCISIRSYDRGDDLFVAFHDNGVGIAPESLEHIFNPFEQAGLVNNHRFGGLGLGLSIARAIMEMHGGSLTAESAGLGQGAAFHFALAATLPPVGVRKSGHVQKAAKGLVTAPLRILLVEDHEPTLTVLSRLLIRDGHTVTSAGTVAGARSLASTHVFDTVISDIGLPDGTGLELMEHLHSQHGLRGIALSGYGMEEDLKRSREVGFITHLVKPVDFRQLRHALQHSLGESA